MNRLTSVLAALAACAASAAFAKEAVYATPDQVHAVNILASPAAEGSEQDNAELEQLHKIEAARTEAQVAAAKFDDEHEDFFVFATVLGSEFKAENLPLTAALGNNISADESANVLTVREYFHRRHPYAVDASLKPACKTKTKDDSYPSSHTLRGWLLGLTLVEIVPEKRDEILARAQEYGHNRLVCGVHHESDVAASRLLAYAIHAVELQNPKYRADLAAARDEIRARLGLADAKEGSAAKEPPAPASQDAAAATRRE